MATWHAANADTKCGGCGLLIPEGDPFCKLTAAQLVRCAPCAERMGVHQVPAAAPPDDDESAIDFFERMNSIRTQPALRLSGDE